MFLRVTPQKGKLVPKSTGKLGPRYVGPYTVAERVGPVAYRLLLPAELASMHDVFHVSRLRKCHPDTRHIISSDTPSISENLSYVEEPIAIADRTLKQLRTKSIPMVKVIWKHHDHPEEATWEIEDKMRKEYPQLFREEFGDQILLRGEGCNTPGKDGS